MVTSCSDPMGLPPKAFLKTQKDQERELTAESQFEDVLVPVPFLHNFAEYPLHQWAPPVERASAVSQSVLPSQWLQDCSGRKLTLESPKPQLHRGLVCCVPGSLLSHRRYSSAAGRACLEDAGDQWCFCLEIGRGNKD